MSLSSTFNTLNLKQWITENKGLLRPPVGNKMIWPHRDMIVMAVGGPNKRDDYHINEGEEFFYQLEGNMTLKVIHGERGFFDIPLGPGDIYLLPPRIPHSPQREANSVGLVIENKRLPHQRDALQWYCKRCRHKLFEESFHLSNIEEQFPPIFDRFYQNHALCQQCGLENDRQGDKGGGDNGSLSQR